MSIDQLDLILYDMYRMDAWLPPLFGKWTEDYKKASYSQWAVDELRDFIAEQIYPRREGSIDEFCKLTHEFMMKTATKIIFSSLHRILMKRWRLCVIFSFHFWG